MRRSGFIFLFVLGAAVMFVFDSSVTLALGMLVQAAAIVLGVFSIATPEFLSADVED